MVRRESRNMFNSKSNFTTRSEAGSDVIKTDPQAEKFITRPVCIRFNYKDSDVLHTYVLRGRWRIWETVSVPHTPFHQH